jgi:hypothetical protein
MLAGDSASYSNNPNLKIPVTQLSNLLELKPENPPIETRAFTGNHPEQNDPQLTPPSHTHRTAPL